MSKEQGTQHSNYRKAVIVNLLMCGTLLSSLATTATTVFAQVDSNPTATSNKVAASTKKTAMSITANSSSIYAGESAAFQFRFYNALTDNNGILKAPTLKLSLSGVSQAVLKNLDLSSLKIMGVTPTLQMTTLVYQFGDLKAGTDIDVALALPTQNGVTPSGTSYSIAASLTSKSLATPITSTSTPVSVASQSTFAVSNAFVNTVGSDVQVAAPRIGDETSWKFNVGLPKLTSGSKFLKEGSKVTVTYKITGSAVYSGVGAGTPEPTTVSADKQTLTWVFDAPTTAAQMSAVNSLFSQDFNVQIKINDDAVAFTQVSTEASVTGEFMDGQSQSKSHVSTITITQLATTTPPTGNGSISSSYFYGAANGNGSYSTQLINPNPTVHPDANLVWKLMGGLGYEQALTEAKRPTQMDITFNMDGHQDPTSFYSAAAVAWVAGDNYSALTRQPSFDLIVEYEDGQTETLIPNVQPNTRYWFTSGQYKLTKSVKTITLKYSYVPAMNYNPSIYLFTTPKAGFTGETTVTPKVRIRGDGSDSGKNAYLESIYDATGLHSFTPGSTPGVLDTPYPGATSESDAWKKAMGYRSVNVVDYAKTEKRVYSQNISVNADNKIKLGENSVTLDLMNLAESQASIDGNIASYVLLPVGVTYSDTNTAVEKVTDNYNSTNRTLLKVNISAHQIPIEGKLTTSFNVTVSDNVLTTGSFDLLTEIDTDGDITLPDTAGSNPFDLMPTKETDVNDIDGDGDLTEPLYVSKRTVDFVGNHGISISSDSGFVGADQQGLLASTEDANVLYRLKLGSETDKTLGNIKIMGVLPSLSDYGLVTLQNRDSQFDLSLTGPITIKDYQDDFDIYYSTDKYVSAAGDLDANTAYPAGIDSLHNHTNAGTTTWVQASAVTDWSKIKSFKLVQKSGATINSSSLSVDIPLSTPSSLSADLLNAGVKAADRSAYMNVALVANNYLPIENIKSGVYVNRTATKVVNYVDTQGNTLAASKNVIGNVGNTYNVSTAEYKLKIAGYTLKKVDGATTGTFADDNEPVTYIYAKNPVKAANLKVNYTDGNGNKIAASKIVTGNIGATYDVSTTKYKLVIKGYTFKKVIGNTKGTLSDKVQTVTYVYTKVATNSTSHDKGKLPQTNESTNPWLTIIGLGGLVTTLFTWFYKKDHREE